MFFLVIRNSSNKRRIGGAALIRGRRLLIFLSQMRRLFEGGAYSSKYGIHQRHNFFADLGLILLKFKHASNTPVYFRYFTRVAYSAGNLTKTFSSEKFIETNNISAIRGKKLFLLFNCMRANKTNNLCHKAYAIK